VPGSSAIRIRSFSLAISGSNEEITNSFLCGSGRPIKDAIRAEPLPAAQVRELALLCAARGCLPLSEGKCASAPREASGPTGGNVRVTDHLPGTEAYSHPIPAVRPMLRRLTRPWRFVDAAAGYGEHVDFVPGRCEFPARSRLRAVRRARLHAASGSPGRREPPVYGCQNGYQDAAEDLGNGEYGEDQ
jgi:hypothetical protein